MKEQIKITESFEWQIGYCAFSVSYSNAKAVQDYIRNQEEHHRTKTFQEEYIAFLNRHNIEFRREHLFEDEYNG